MPDDGASNPRWPAAAAARLPLLGMVLVLAVINWAFVPTAAADPGEPSDEKPSIRVDAECLGPDIPPRAEVNVNLWGLGLDGRQLEWEMERDGNRVSGGTFAWSEDEGGGPGSQFFDDLIPGRHTLTVLDGARVVVATQFDVLRCVTVTSTGCRTVTFTNPAENPAVRIKYGAGDVDTSYDDENVDDGRAVTVPPGSQRTVRTLRHHFGWGATGAAPPNGRRSFAGEDYEVEVPQHCGATMTRAAVHCSTGGLAVVDLWFRPPHGRQVTYKIIDLYDVVRSGRVGADDHVRLWLPSSYYTLRAYTNAAVLPYERVDFQVVPCLRVQVRCDSAKFINSNYDQDYDVRVRTSSAGKATVIRVEAERSKKIAISPGSVRWKARPRLEEVPELWDIRGGSGSVRVPADCSAVVPDPGDRLAHTGGPAPWPLGGAALAVAGAAFVLGRRRSTSLVRVNARALRQAQGADQQR